MTRRRKFNTAGPCKPEWHYMLPSIERLPMVQELIDDQLYFVLHAPRQTGKTTVCHALAQELTASGQYVAVVLSVEAGKAFPDDIDRAETTILETWQDTISWQVPQALLPPPWPVRSPGSRIGSALQAWAEVAPRPLVVFIDEIDALQNQVLVSVLHQIRARYTGRPQAFPWSLALIGMRDVRDYKVASGGSERLNTSSPFNIQAESLTLANFTAEEVATLYEQHTTETGQVFTPEAKALAFEATQGQPWLVNALARESLKRYPDPTDPITAEVIEQARQELIRRHDTHFNSVANVLREPRVQQVLRPVLAGSLMDDVPADDIQFVMDLGLCRLNPRGQLEIANPIYGELIPNMLTYSLVRLMPVTEYTWLTPTGSLDTERLLAAFLAFWRQHGQPLLHATPYPEIAPHLVLMAFLHRVANAGGTLEREYAIGSGRMDLCLRYGNTTVAMELKTWRDGRPDPLSEGLTQLESYLSGLGLETGWLVIFDQRSKQPPIAERTCSEAATTPQGRVVSVVRA